MLRTSLRGFPSVSTSASSSSSSSSSNLVSSLFSAKATISSSATLFSSSSSSSSVSNDNHECSRIVRNYFLSSNNNNNNNNNSSIITSSSSSSATTNSSGFLKSTSVCLIAPPKPANRLSSAEAMQPNQPIFKRKGPVHLYANKDVAMKGVVDDRFYGAKRFREILRRWWSDKVARFYFSLTAAACLFAWLVFMQQFDATIEDRGLVGPKKRVYKSRLTVVLDIDETICSYGDKAYRLRAPLVPRPYLAELLDYLCSIDCEIILWGACSDRYMKQILHALDPQGTRFSSFLTRDESWYSRDFFYEKNVSWLKRNINDIVIIENRPLSVRGCNSNALLVDDFVRAEYMDTGMDHPQNDHALLTVKEIVNDLEKTGEAVPRYFANKRLRHPDIKEIPCHLAMRQMPDELAVGHFYFVGDKFKPGAPPATEE